MDDGAERLELRLLVGAPGGAPAALELDAPADATVGAAAEAFAHSLGVGNGELFLERTGSWLPRGDRLAAAGFRHGDRLLLAAERNGVGRPAPPTSAALELVVVGGPSSGRSYPLPPGEHVVGRDPACDVVLDDPALSSRHLRLTVDGAGTVTATDLRSRNGTSLEGASLEPNAAEPVPTGAVLRAGRTLLAVEAPRPAAATAPAHVDGTVTFNRPPRVRRPLEPVVRPFPPPPDSPQRGRLPLAASLVPLVLGVTLYFVTGYPTMLFFSALSPVMAVTTYVEDRRSGRKGFARRSRDYREQLAELRDELEEARRREVRERRQASPSAAEVLARARALDPAVWERRLGDSDFLRLRLGTADRPALFALKLEQGGDSALRKEAESLGSWYASVADVPVDVPLLDLGAVGLCGPIDRVDPLARWLVAQAATLHSPRELAVAAALGEARAADWQWLLWLPHVAGGGPLAGAASGPIAARRLVEDALHMAEERQERAEAGFGSSRIVSLAALLVLAAEDAATRLALELEQPATGGRPVVVVVDDGEELAESVAAPALETIVRRGRDDVRVLCACERQAAQRAFGGWLRERRKEEHGLLLAPDADVDGDLLGVRLPRRTNPVFPQGRGYLVERGTIELVQVAVA